jgi:hypothetical protein
VRYLKLNAGPGGSGRDVHGKVFSQLWHMRLLELFGRFVGPPEKRSRPGVMLRWPARWSLTNSLLGGFECGAILDSNFRTRIRFVRRALTGVSFEVGVAFGRGLVLDEQGLARQTMGLSDASSPWGLKFFSYFRSIWAKPTTECRVRINLTTSTLSARRRIKLSAKHLHNTS